MLGVEVETMKTIAVVAIVVLVLLAVLAVKLMVNGTVRLIALVALAGLAVAVWTQRQSLQDCAQEVKDEAALAAEGGGDAAAQCTFFGFEVSVDLPDR